MAIRISEKIVIGNSLISTNSEYISKKLLPNPETGYVLENEDLIKLADKTTENGFARKYCLDESEVKQLKLNRNSKK